MAVENKKSRLRRFLFACAAVIAFVYGFLPWLTQSLSPLRQMQQHLQETGIDPSRYYYTDVEQVSEAEAYLRERL
ncbi:MAG: hypothetical protein GX087_03810 [Desulfobulbaceae bacterium]|nr:hypothetical protein [Desulfobulbaceae bacterium]